MPTEKGTLSASCRANSTARSGESKTDAGNSNRSRFEVSARPPLALASVNLTARKPAKTTASGNTYLRKLIARHHLAPALAVAFAGRFDYRSYSWRDRQIIRFIMLLTRGPTDPDTCVEYTSWRIAELQLRS